MTDWLNPLAVAAKRMNAGDVVAETYVWGTGADQLRGSGLVSHEVIQEYRLGSVQQAKSVYREGAAKMMEQRHGEQVRAYFDMLENRGRAA